MLDNKKFKKNKMKKIFKNLSQEIDFGIRHNIIETLNIKYILKLIINNAIILFLLFCFFFSFRNFFRFRFLFWFQFFFWFWFFFGIWVFFKVWFFMFYFYFI